MSQEFEAIPPNPPGPPPSSETRRSGPRLKIPAPPAELPHEDPDHGTPHRRLSRMVGVNFLLSLILILMLGFVIFRQAEAPPTAAAPADQSDQTKALASEVDRLKGEIDGLAKKLGSIPAQVDPTPQIKSLDDKVADLGKALAETPAQLQALSQKVEEATKGDAAPKVDAIDKKVEELTHAVDSLKAEVAGRAAPVANPTAITANSGDEVDAMAQAVALFKQGKYAEAREAFTKLQSSAPDDARVWYFSALANGLATRNWQGESDRLVKVGVEKEKAGSPSRDQIDAAFAELTVNNGKDWLNYFRKTAAR